MTVALTRYAHMSSTSGGTGKSNATTGDDRAYATQSAAEAAEQKDLTVVNQVTVSSVSGTFTNLEALTFSSSGATATMIDQTGTDMIYEVLTGTPTTADTITGTTSSATCDIDTIDDTSGASFDLQCTGTSGTPDTTKPTWDGWTTDATNKITIDGLDQFDGYVMKVTGAGIGYQINEDYITIKRIHWLRDNADEATNFLETTPTGGTSTAIYIEQCNVVCTHTSAGQALNCGGSYNVYFSNNMIVGPFTTAIEMPLGAAAGYEGVASNNSIYGQTGNGIEAVFGLNGLRHVYNNIVEHGAGGTDYSLSNVDASGGNISSDTTSPEVGLQSTTVTFVSTTDDLHLANGTSAADGAWTDLRTDPTYPVTIDADGNTRIAASDIGAHEYQTAGSIVPIVANHYMRMIET